MLSLLRANTSTTMRQMSAIALIPFLMISFCNQPFPMATTLSNPPSTVNISDSSFIFQLFLGIFSEILYPSIDLFLLGSGPFCCGKECFYLFVPCLGGRKHNTMFWNFFWFCLRLSFRFCRCLFFPSCKTAYQILEKSTCCFSFTF